MYLFDITATDTRWRTEFVTLITADGETPAAASAYFGPRYADLDVPLTFVGDRVLLGDRLVGLITRAYHQVCGQLDAEGTARCAVPSGFTPHVCGGARGESWVKELGA